MKFLYLFSEYHNNPIPPSDWRAASDSTIINLPFPAIFQPSKVLPSNIDAKLLLPLLAAEDLFLIDISMFCCSSILLEWSLSVRVLAVSVVCCSDAFIDSEKVTNTIAIGKRIEVLMIGIIIERI